MVEWLRDQSETTDGAQEILVTPLSEWLRTSYYHDLGFSCKRYASSASLSVDVNDLESCVWSVLTKHAT